MHLASLPRAAASLATLAGWLAMVVFSIALVGGKPMVDPAYSTVDWALARKKLLLYVRSRPGFGAPSAADDIVQGALAKAHAPETRRWKSDTETIVEYLGSLANNEMFRLRKSYGYRKARHELTDEVLDGHGSEALGAEAVHDVRVDVDRHDRVFAALTDRLRRHPLALFLVGIYDGGTTDARESTERALAAGHSMADITQARQKIHREIQKLLDEEALDARGQDASRARGEG